jgi:F-type H+-transporting ATPase subunit a
MTAGHVVILSLVGLIFIFGKGGASPIAGYGIAPLSVAFSLFVNLLEILVAFLQAYIFTLLSALFIGFAAHSHHEEEGHEAQH